MSIPKPWSEIYIGRAVSRTQGKHTQNGFVYRYASTKATGTEYIRRFVVKWEKGEDEVLEADIVKPLLTQRFLEDSWVLPEIRALQKAIFNFELPIPVPIPIIILHHRR